MRKNSKRMLALLLTMVMISSAFALTGCGGSGAKSKYAGKWTAVIMDMDGLVMAVDPETDGEMSIEIKDGGKAEFIVDGDSESCDWKEDGDSLIITVEGVDMTAVAGEKENTIVFKNWMDFGIDVTFGKVGTDAADPANYETDL